MKTKKAKRAKLAVVAAVALAGGFDHGNGRAASGDRGNGLVDGSQIMASKDGGGDSHGNGVVGGDKGNGSKSCTAVTREKGGGDSHGNGVRLASGGGYVGNGRSVNAKTASTARGGSYIGNG